MRTCFVQFDADAVNEEKEKRQQDANAGKNDGTITVSSNYVALFLQSLINICLQTGPCEIGASDSKQKNKCVNKGSVKTCGSSTTGQEREIIDDLVSVTVFFAVSLLVSANSTVTFI